MHWNIETIFAWFVVFFGLGAFWLIFDHKYGERVFRIGYNWTHRNPLPANAEIGFLSAQPWRNQFSRAFWIATVQFGALAYLTHENPLTYLLIWVCGIVATFLGILSGKAIGKAFDNSDVVFDTAEKVSRGEISLKPQYEMAKEAVKDAVADATAKTLDAVEAVKNTAKEYLKKPAPEVKPVVPACPDQSVGEAPKPVEPEPDPYAAINKYANKS